jgi:hypothetical protein
VNSKWNYRVKKSYPSRAFPDEPWYCIVEAHYATAKHAAANTQNAFSGPVRAGSDSLDGLRADLKLMLQALERPVIEGGK